jgi:dTDP-D-glucose 4,6-dehydratase
MDNTKLKQLDWAPTHSLKDGLENAYQWYVDNMASARSA